MGRVWRDDDEQERPPLSNWRVHTVIVLLIIFILVFTSCGGLESVELPAAPAPAPAPQSLDMGLCQNVINGETSTLVPGDWDDWCQGVNSSADAMAQDSTSNNIAVCEYFWTADDQELVDYAVSQGGTRDWSIGFVDFMWWYC